MSIRNCLGNIDAIPKQQRDMLIAKLDDLVSKGMDETDASIQVLKEFHKEIHDELNDLRKTIGLKPEAYVSEIDKNIKSLNDEYETIITNKKTELQNAIQEPTTNEMDVRQQAGDGEGMGEGNIQPEITTKESENTGEKEKVGIKPPPTTFRDIEVVSDDNGNMYTHAGTEAKRAALGLPERTIEQTKKSEQLNAEADAYIKDGKFDRDKLTEKAKKGEPFTPVERVAFHKFAANLDEAFSKDVESGKLDKKSKEFDERLADVEDAYATLEKAGSNSGSALQSIKNAAVADDTLAGFFIREKEASKVDVLTDEQKVQAEKEFNELRQRKADLEKLNEEANVKISELEAKLKIAEAKKSSSTGGKKTKQEYAKERDEIFKSIKDKWKNAGKDSLQSGIPFGAQFKAIAPDVLRLAKNLVEDGVYELSEIVKRIHGQLSDGIPELKEKDIQDMLAGEYNEKKPQRKEVAVKFRELQQEAKYLNEIDKILSKEEPKSPTAKVERNAKLKELSDKLKELRKENKLGQYSDIAKVKAEINRNKAQAEKIQAQLKKGDFAKPEKPQSIKDEELKKIDPELYKKRLAAKDAYIKAKDERELRLLKQEYKNRTFQEKGASVFRKIWNTPKAALGTADVSYAGRQGIWNVSRKMLSNPFHPKGLFYNQKSFIRDMGNMYASLAHEPTYRRLMHDITESPRYEMAKKSGLAITDVNSPLARAREEYYGPNYAEEIPLIGKKIKLTGDVKIPFTKRKIGNLGDTGFKIPFTEKHLKEVGGIVKASERAFTAMGMLQRWEHFNQFADAMENRGLTFEKDPQAFKEAAIYANQASGVGNLGQGKLKSAAGFLSTFIWSTKLAASRLQLLTKWANLKFWTKVPKEVKLAYMKDSIKFIAMGASVLAMAKAMGLQVELDPRSSDFGKVKIGDTRYDIWGGMAQWVVLFSKLWSGESKSTQTGEIIPTGSNYGQTSRFDIAERFVRGKATPEVGAIANAMEGKNLAGEKTDATKELSRLFIPLIGQDVDKALEDKSVQESLMIALLTAHGVGVSQYPSREEQDNKAVDWDEVYKESINSKETRAGAGTMIKDPKTRVERKMTAKELDDFETKRDAAIKKELDKLKTDGLPYVEDGVVKVKPPSEITVSEMRAELKKIKANASSKIREEMFPDTEMEKRMKGRDEKILDRFKKTQQR